MQMLQKMWVVKFPKGKRNAHISPSRERNHDFSEQVSPIADQWGHQVMKEKRSADQRVTVAMSPGCKTLSAYSPPTLPMDNVSMVS
jgi:hypothetical protein